MRRHLEILLVGLGLLLPATAGATTARFVPLFELVRRADAVVLGEVIHSDSFWQGPQIFTLARVAVHEVWHGLAEPPATLDVLTPGGQVEDIAQAVGGAARLPLQAALVLHLKATSTGEYLPVGMAQGVFRVRLPEQPRPAYGRDGARIGALLSRRDAEQLAVDRPDIDRLIMPPGAAPAAMPATLAALRQAVQKAARAQP